uniref:AlNc14C254G9704 protein n=1 Tax=Albugo laibachii Nc14 TaxID=890382 RepID=F0WTM7_9STRA|nr:AlNc14C254G9704 [Albugo laibachii Nc14]|eukprot:CCA24719.1 AlNc14C254G9704 [Albugo laibachii Nc14]
MEPVGLQPTIDQGRSDAEELCRSFIQERIQNVFVIIHDKDMKYRAFRSVAVEGCAAVLANVGMFQLFACSQEPEFREADDQHFQQYSRSVLEIATVKLHHHTLSSLDELFRSNLRQLELLWSYFEACRIMEAKESETWSWYLDRDQVDKFIVLIGKHLGCPVLRSTQIYIMRQASTSLPYSNIGHILDLVQRTKLMTGKQLSSIRGDDQIEPSKNHFVPRKPAPCEIDRYSSFSAKNSLPTSRIKQSSPDCLFVSTCGSTKSTKASELFPASKRSDQHTYNTWAQNHKVHNVTDRDSRSSDAERCYQNDVLVQRNQEYENNSVLHDLRRKEQHLLSRERPNGTKVVQPESRLVDAKRSSFETTRMMLSYQNKPNVDYEGVISEKKQKSITVRLPQIKKVPTQRFSKVEVDTRLSASEPQGAPTHLRKSISVLPPVSLTRMATCDD